MSWRNSPDPQANLRKAGYHDLAETALFYEKVLGLPLALDQGRRRIYRVSNDGYLGFCQRGDTPERPTGIILTLVTPEVDAWYHRLRDPPGYLVEIQRFLDPAWPGR